MLLYFDSRYLAFLIWKTTRLFPPDSSGSDGCLSLTKCAGICVSIIWSCTSELLRHVWSPVRSGLGVTDTSSPKSPECDQELPRSGFPLDEPRTLLGGAPLAAKKGGKNLTAQKSPASKVQNFFNLSFTETQGWGRLKHGWDPARLHSSLPSLFPLWSEQCGTVISIQRRQKWSSASVYFGAIFFPGFKVKTCRLATPSPAPTLWASCRTSAATRATTGPLPVADTRGCQRPWTCTPMRLTTNTRPAWRGRMDRTPPNLSPRIWSNPLIVTSRSSRWLSKTRLTRRWPWMGFTSLSWRGFHSTETTSRAGRTASGTICRSTSVLSRCPVMIRSPARAATGPWTRTRTTCLKTGASWEGDDGSKRRTSWKKKKSGCRRMCLRGSKAVSRSSRCRAPSLWGSRILRLRTGRSRRRSPTRPLWAPCPKSRARTAAACPAGAPTASPPIGPSAWTALSTTSTTARPRRRASA